ncbi:helix-turn-helix transcriptional regulator [Microbispora bryophytorum]|nr:hypothetical protein [Microbispora bryophytorum]MBD3135110.1 hypothetical protein [Microbispora bryophytorum]TQS08663.1 hypothetical protein FLX07_05255 [Microbispora bryophytorum]
MASKSNLLDKKEICTLLNISRPHLWRLRKEPGFPEPVERSGAREYWSQVAILRWAAMVGRHLAARVPFLYWPVPVNPAPYGGARVIDGYTVLSWDAEFGRLSFVYPPLMGGWVSLNELAADVVSDAAAIVVLRPDWRVSKGPNLDALDLAEPYGPYRVLWEDLARVLGMPVPYWPINMRNPQEMLRWRPGIETVCAQAQHELNAGPLFQLAAAYSDDHPTSRTLRELAHIIVHRAFVEADRNLEYWSDYERPVARDVVFAAKPLPMPDPHENPLPQDVRESGWAEVFQREDTLAEQCVSAALQWNGGKHFPFSGVVHLEPEDEGSAVRVEWTSRLVDAPRDARYRVLSSRLEGRALQDPWTGLPVIGLADKAMIAAVPKHLPTVSPLHSIVLDGSVWIRTEDGQLFLAPAQWDGGNTWGYSGTGPTILAHLLDQLLGDISAPAPSTEVLGSSSATGLEALTETDFPHGTVITRQQLEEARNARSRAGGT